MTQTSKPLEYPLLITLKNEEFCDEDEISSPSFEEQLNTVDRRDILQSTIDSENMPLVEEGHIDLTIMGFEWSHMQMGWVNQRAYDSNDELVDMTEEEWESFLENESFQFQITGYQHPCTLPLIPYQKYQSEKYVLYVFDGTEIDNRPLLSFFATAGSSALISRIYDTWFTETPQEDLSIEGVISLNPEDLTTATITFPEEN